ncbi:MAG: ABC transporter ATP-binding protein [Chloroflexi bacterium CG15_BIG_FIL_POST_REV_8_21_14_020_46_15]|nr:MAG: ABC transporter ATP-binding protein [Chloroflexi bacterium CG15_BIG_FIL_POST_REV_8_21_14_020_46_15]
MLEVKCLKLTLNGKPIINGLNLEVKEAKIHGLLGMNGAGKTSLANLIMGISYPDEGSIIFEERDVTRCTISERAKMGLTLAWQEPARFEGLSIREYLRLNKNLSLSEVENYLWTVGLPPGEYLDRAVDANLSGGERKRVELASVMAMKPKVAILDEPDSGIDVVSLPHIMNGITEMSKQGSAVLLITHSEEAVGVAEEVSIICAGKIINSGPPKEMCRWFKNNCQTCNHIGKPSYKGV